ncbi:unnamed protein product [Pseudo-nitzschia multistriata]|uniref:Mitochondrial proton/calcium exchanger protein n=1 Tax=Pseudo-nitzschia multistriata TaxID=183589 RepID=A0A448YXJ0_9STRA|nr:unnamed protein product [Pseudo-nitzschia multistriata]
MLATAAAVRKVVESDGRRRVMNNGPKNGLLASSSWRRTGSVAPATSIWICIDAKSHASSSASTKNNSSSRDQILSLSIPSSPSSPFCLSSRRRINCNFPIKQTQRKLESQLQITSMTYHQFLLNHNGSSKYNKGSELNHLFPQYEVRAFLSTSPPSSGSTTKKLEKSQTKIPGYSRQAKIPIPKSSPTVSTSMNPLASIDVKAIGKGSVDMTIYVTKALVKFMIKLPGNIVFYATHPTERREKTSKIKESIKKEVDHYWIGIKLLMADVKTARALLRRTLQGSTLTRRERKQLLRTVSDLFRLVPMSMFLIIPFMEFALPFALKIFPNMLPSTFQDSLKNEENMKRELQSRIAMAEFFQETMERLAKEQKRIAAKQKDGEDESADSFASKQEASASDMLNFLDRARKGEMVPPDAIIQYAEFFQDDLTLDNMPRMQLINMCKYMSIPPYGSDPFLRFQLRHRIRMLKEDDQRILWEGIDSLTKMELREACQERGMRSTGLSKEAYKQSLQQWLDLSVHKNVPISLLIMSRTFFLQEEITSPGTAVASDETHSVTGLADAISGMDKEVLNEVILQVATSKELKSDPDVRKIQLEVVKQQNEKIKEEREERDAKKKKDTTEKEEPQTKTAQIGKENIAEGRATQTADVETINKEEILDAIDVKVDELQADLKTKAAEIEMGERELSPEEMESISQLLSADPVVKEREHLDRIKQAMREEDEPETKAEGHDDRIAASPGDTSTLEMYDSDKVASSIIEKLEMEAAKEADKHTSFTTELNTAGRHPESDRVDIVNGDVAEEVVNEKPEDPVVARLKKRIESMVDKIEVQLSDVQVKIGDKLHYLDKDMDGILSREEMASVLSQVLKDLSFEEALEIADEMDENKDGVFTVQELINWIETNKLVKFESEGRDAEMDKIMENHSEGHSNEKDETGSNKK